MKNLFRISGLFLLIFCSSTIFSQKCAHLNFGSLIAQMPQTKQADLQLQDFQKILTDKREEMAAAWQKDAKQFMAEAQTGILSQKQQQAKEKKLEERRQEIITFEQEIEKKVQAKRQELLEPILKDVEQVIKEVAVENGYDAVLDTSIFNAVLYALDSKDLMPLVKKKLGIE
jgi:outer membrane protein